MQRSIFILLFFTLLLVSCNREDYTLDYRNMDFPKIPRLEKSQIDSILVRDERFSKRFMKEITGSTDKSVYSFGETVYLTITNNAEKTIHFSSRKNRIFLAPFQITEKYKANLKKNQLKKGVAVFGSFTYDSPILINLHFNVANAEDAETLGMEAFENTIQPGDKIVFAVLLPNREGYYRFIFGKYYSDEEASWGLNHLILSNRFQILSD